jgi:hypothetical protein
MKFEGFGGRFGSTKAEQNSLLVARIVVLDAAALPRSQGCLVFNALLM